MNKCGTCKHWTRNTDPGQTGTGVCKNLIDYDSVDMTVPSCDSGTVIIETVEGFFCGNSEVRE